MIRFFRSPQTATLFLIPLILLAFWLREVFHTQIITGDHSLPLWNALASFFNILPSWIRFIILFILISGQAVYLNLMLNKHEVHYKNTFLPALIFALLISSLPSMMVLHPVHLVNLILIRIFDRSFTLFKNEQAISALFDSAFLAGLASLIYLPAIVLLPVLFINLSLLRQFRFKEWLICFIAFLIPYFLVSTMLFWNHMFVKAWSDYASYFTIISIEFESAKSLPVLLLGVYSGILLLFSLIKLRINYRKNIIRSRSFQQIFFIYLLIAASGLLLLNKLYVVDFAFLLIPVSVFCSYYFVSAKKRLWLYECALWALIALMVWNHTSGM